MKRYEKAICFAIGIIVIYLALAALRYVISFLLRYWILLIVLVAAIYAVFRYCKAGHHPWWLDRIQGLLLRVRRKSQKPDGEKGNGAAQ